MRLTAVNNWEVGMVNFALHLKTTQRGRSGRLFHPRGSQEVHSSIWHSSDNRWRLSVSFNINPSPPLIHDSWQNIETARVFPLSRLIQSMAQREGIDHENIVLLYDGTPKSWQMHPPPITFQNQLSVKWHQSNDSHQAYLPLCVCGLRLSTYVGGGHSYVTVGSCQ